MILYKKILFLCALLFLSFFSGMGQKSLQDLKKRQDELTKEISETAKALEFTKKMRVKTINQLYLLNRQIKKRKLLIDEYNNEIQIIDKKIRNNEQEIDSIQKRISQMKDDYTEIIRKYYLIYKYKGNLIGYIISANNVNQAYKRLKYYQQYMEYGHKIFNELKDAEEKIKKENENLENNRVNELRVLNKLKNEEEKYTNEKALKNTYVLSLQKRERELRKDLKNKEGVRKKLEETMKNMMEEERINKRGIKLNAGERLIAMEFEANRGKLLWPTEGIIIENFGFHRHPVLKNVMEKNDGIDIMTKKGSYARAVFDGEVRKIVAIPGANETVIIKHGNFYTVYQNVYKVNVKVGQKVKKLEKIGIVFTNPKNKETVLHFEIWKGTKNINPEEWLIKNK
ncbi:MAG TPA: hypothetical protein ENK25_05430 [Bacteroidetes bacterium]|nr:hypothetical protein [Bacteroidota bacterium]